jgi:hypothetical protein
MEQHYVTFGTGEVDIRSSRDESWGKQGDFLGHEKLILSHNKTNYGTKQGDFLGQEKLILGHNKMNYVTE